MMGAKDLSDLKSLVEKQISSQYSQALSSITKKEILDQIEKNYVLDLPINLIEQEIDLITRNLNLKIEKNIKKKMKNCQIEN